MEFAIYKILKLHFHERTRCCWKLRWFVSSTLLAVSSSALFAHSGEMVKAKNVNCRKSSTTRKGLHYNRQDWEIYLWNFKGSGILDSSKIVQPEKCNLPISVYIEAAILYNPKGSLWKQSTIQASKYFAHFYLILNFDDNWKAK